MRPRKVPNILPVMTVAEWLQYSQTCDLRLVLHHRTEQSLNTLETRQRRP